MTGGEGAASRGVRASSSGGTPKRGYDCNDCLDWRSVPEVTELPDGGTVTRSVPCPACQPAAAALPAPDQTGDNVPATPAPGEIGPHKCPARALPVGVHILHDGVLCAITTAPTTREGKTRFVLDTGERTEHVERPADRLVTYWRLPRPAAGTEGAP